MSADPRPVAVAPRVLLVDRDPGPTDLAATALRRSGCEVRVATTGLVALRVARDFEPVAVVLGDVLPDADGRTIMQRMRDLDPGVCVLILAGHDSAERRIADLTAGADDVLSKPCHPEEIAARVRGALRRAGSAPSASTAVLEVGPLRLDQQAHQVMRGDDRIDLTATEFELLRFLMRRPGSVLSKREILHQVWKYDFGGQAHVVELYISYLRKKIDVGRDPMIHTVRGVGYVLRAPARWAPR